MASTFGKQFTISTFGESHGSGVGVVIDGCPPGIALDLDRLGVWMARRRPGQSEYTTPRNEADAVRVLSGLSPESETLGSPICLLVHNEDKKPQHYQDMKTVFRPSHADYTSFKKYGIRAASGGGRASARETIGRVAAAAIAEQVLETLLPDIRIVAWVQQVKDVAACQTLASEWTREHIDEHPLRCPDRDARKAMGELILAAKHSGDSVGGIIACTMHGLPVGLGEPVFDKFEADLAKAMLSLPASKGFDIGSGFDCVHYFGSEHNDAFRIDEDQQRVTTTSNHSGGVQGGITNGQPVTFRVAFKPVSTIFKPQQTVNDAGEEVTYQPQAGRHDPCVLPRAVPMVEAMATLVLVDHCLRQRSLVGTVG